MTDILQHVCFVHVAADIAHWVQSNFVEQGMILPKIKVGRGQSISTIQKSTLM